MPQGQRGSKPTSLQAGYKSGYSTHRLESLFRAVEARIVESDPRVRVQTLRAGGCELPHFKFIGREGGGGKVRIGLFAAIHGDEPAGTHALMKFLEVLCAEHGLGEGYDLF